MEITRTDRSRRDQIDFENLGFGEVFSDHMLIMDYRDGEWGPPKILPYGTIEVFPAMCSFHYGQMVFEGLKAFYTRMGAINIFRPQKYHERMNRSCRDSVSPR